MDSAAAAAPAVNDASLGPNGMHRSVTVSNAHLLRTLDAMGVTDYDPLVLSALSEYARSKTIVV
jgi:hypothetical protein